MRRVSSEIYDKDYYKRHEEGFQRMLTRLDPYIKKFKKNSKILDVGCGSGEMAVFLGRIGHEIIGVDYSKDAIRRANDRKLSEKKSVQNKLKFIRGEATKLNFGENQFDYVISIDVFEHLYQEQLDEMLKSVKKCLKPKGKLLIHTEPNKIYLNITHKYYIYPISELLIKINKILTGNDYPGLSKDPRNEDHKKQHVNEPTYFYLKNLFKRFGFEGKIKSIGLHKPVLSWKDCLYNVVVLYGPLSKLSPLRWLFEYEYICFMENKK